jgi:hypothetical protein
VILHETITRLRAPLTSGGYGNQERNWSAATSTDFTVKWSHKAVAEVVGDEPLQTDLVCLQVTALGGQQPWPWEAVPEFQISSWGGTKAQASALDLTVRSAIFELLGTAVTGGRVNGIGIRLAGLWSPAEDTNRPRYRSDVALDVYP